MGYIVLAISACSKSWTSEAPVNNFPTLTPMPTTMSMISSKIASSSIQELTHYADLVVIGQPVTKEGIINTARDPNNLSKPDPRFFSINQLYKVEIEQILKGESLKVLLVAQNQGLLSLDTIANPTVSDIEYEIRRNKNKTFIPLSLNTRYLFFLRILDEANYDLNGYKSASIYAGVAEPWRFEITADGTVIPETLLPRLSQYFPSEPLELVIEAMNEPYVPGQNMSPYPPPSANESHLGTPYP